MAAAKKLVRLLMVVVGVAGPGAAALSMDYYGMSCPFADMVVRNVGCDASVLLDSTPDNTAEKDAPPNKSLRGFEVIDRIKQALEMQCPGVVSCADIVALAARDAVLMAGGPYYVVPLGRRDGTRSNAADTVALPPPFLNATELAQLFATHNLNLQDMVALSGGHTLGAAHCANFKNRLATEAATLDSSLGSSLSSVCAAGGDGATATFDRTSTMFDGVYFRELQQRRGLLSSDQTLFESPETKRLVNMFAMNQAYFFFAFQQGMLKMGQLNLKEGTIGEVRRSCRIIN
uniref:Peroxidase n=1 Tax=Oryza brachyantha TaxID=4533 RepID=J3MPT3_ORYBR